MPCIAWLMIPGASLPAPAIPQSAGIRTSSTVPRQPIHACTATAGPQSSPRYPHHVTVPVDASLLLTFHSTPKQTRTLSLIWLDSKYLQLIASPIIIPQRCLFVFAPPPSCADVLDRRFSDDISNLPTQFHLHLDSYNRRFGLSLRSLIDSQTSIA